MRVRLAGSSVQSQGRVEVLYNGQWGTICDDYWDISDAHVICRMLNYSGATFAVRNAYFGRGSRSSPIWLDSVKCRGDESTIAACRHDGWRQNDCYHSEDAGVVCWTESAPAYEGIEFCKVLLIEAHSHRLNKLGDESCDKIIYWTNKSCGHVFEGLVP